MASTKATAWEEDKHPRDHGRFSSGPGAAGSEKVPHPKEVLADFNRSPHTVTSEELDSTNRELEDAGADWRVVPKEGGDYGFEALPLDQIEDVYGENWTIDRDPETGRLTTGDADYFADVEQELIHDPERWANAFQQRAEQGELTADAVERANQSLADAGQDSRLVPDDDGRWGVQDVAALEDEYGEDWGVGQTAEGQWVAGPRDWLQEQAGAETKQQKAARRVEYKNRLSQWFRERYGGKAFDPAKHPRGHEGNPGQFSSGGDTAKYGSRERPKTKSGWDEEALALERKLGRTTERPADPVFHDKRRREIEDLVADVIGGYVDRGKGPELDAIYNPKYGATNLIGRRTPEYHAGMNVLVDREPNGAIGIGTHRRDFTIPPDMPLEEVAYHLRRALKMKVGAEDKEKYGKKDYQPREAHADARQWDAALEQGEAEPALPLTDHDAPLLELQDIRQADDYSCGAACTASCGAWFRVGPETLEEWKTLLGTTEERSTLPGRIVSVLQSLGLTVEPRQEMTLEELRQCWLAGRPVITPCQEYGIPSKQASEKYGHYLVIIGVAHGYVFVQDPSTDNLVASEGSDQAPGRNMIRADTWLKVWHDHDADGNEYRRFGIVIGPPGSAPLFADKGQKVWDESQHPRNHGQFSSTQGESGSSEKPSSEHKPAESKPEGQHPLAAAYSKVKVSAKDRLAVASKVGHAAFVRLPGSVQKGLTSTYAAGKVVMHYAETSYRIGRNVALEVAKERGADQATIDRVAKLTGSLDAILGWTVNFPVATALTGSPLLGKAASWAPAASAAYVVYSGLRNPFKTIKAAVRALAGKGTAAASTGHKGHEDALKTFAAGVLDLLDSGADPDWTEALLVVALDLTHDGQAALDMVREVLEEGQDFLQGGEKDWNANEHPPRPGCRRAVKSTGAITAGR